MAKVLYGKVWLPNATRANQVYSRITTVALRLGFVPYSAQGKLPHAPGSSVNATDRSVTLCYTHPNPNFIDEAQLEILNYLEDRGWVSGDFGTWDDGLE